MKVGDSIKFDFAGSKKEGLVHRVCAKNVYIKVDFERHKGKILKRKLSALEGGKTKEKNKTKK